MGRLNPCTAAHGSPEDKRRKLVQVVWLVLVFVSAGGLGAGAPGSPGGGLVVVGWGVGFW